jgi:peptide/nickel transport system substrate-binding protein
MKRRQVLAGLSAAALPIPALAQGTASRTLRVIMGMNLASIDPIWTTAPATKDYAFLVFDQLVAVDNKYVPKPQMVDGWTVDDDGKTYTFTLRDGLKFHDNEPVRSQDCVASIKRWAARDGFGQAIMAVTDEMSVMDDKRFRIRLKKAFPLLPAALGKSNSSQCFIMPERIAKTDPMTQIKESIGSGPFKFVKDEWVSGAKASFAKFDQYVPRGDVPDGISGARVPKVDRVEWSIISDSATASAAMQSGEQDYWRTPIWDLLPMLRKDPKLVVQQRLTGGTYSMLRFNHLQPPFNNPAIRQAVAMAIDQREYMRAIMGDEGATSGVCESFYPCDTAYGTDYGAEILKVRSLDKAKAALKAAGYAGEKVVQLAVMDLPSLAAVSQVTDDLLRQMGFKTEFVSTDFGTMMQRRVSKEPVDRGGWNIFHTEWNAPDILNPAVNELLRENGRSAWFGWPTDEKLEALRTQWFDATTDEAQKKIALDIQAEAFKSLPYIPLGFFSQQHVWSKKLTGVLPAPVTLYYNVAKG